MKDFIKKFIYFIVPFSFYIILIIVTDPYNYWNNCRLIPLETKLNISRDLNGRLWKVVQYEQHPKANILLGDSRIDLINSERIRELTGEDYFNFGYPSATLEEIIKTFWFAAERTKLENVILGCSFNLYNEYNNKDLIEATFSSANQFRYILNGANIKAVASSFYHMARGSADANISAPDMNVNAFWTEKIEGPAANFYKLYKYPENYYHELKKIADYCDENGINLLFYIPPTHTDLQAQITRYNLDEEDHKFREDLQSLGTVVDFDYESWLTSHRDNFTDPFHIDIRLDTIVINALINQEYAYARFSQRENSL